MQGVIWIAKVDFPEVILVGINLSRHCFRMDLSFNQFSPNLLPDRRYYTFIGPHVYTYQSITFYQRFLMDSFITKFIIKCHLNFLKDPQCSLLLDGAPVWHFVSAGPVDNVD